ncbi:TPA: hypothetical protein ACKFCW_004431 [Citrobacter farmeri]
MLPFLILLFCSSPETARMILIYATDESAARLQALEDFARLNDSGFAASAQTPYEWENPHGDQLFIESVYPVPSGDLSAIRRMLGDDDAPYTDKHLIAGLMLVVKIMLLHFVSCGSCFTRRQKPTSPEILPVTPPGLCSDKPRAW